MQFLLQVRLMSCLADMQAAKSSVQDHVPEGRDPNGCFHKFGVSLCRGPYDKSHTSRSLHLGSGFLETPNLEACTSSNKKLSLNSKAVSQRSSRSFETLFSNVFSSELSMSELRRTSSMGRVAEEKEFQVSYSWTLESP